MALCYSSARFRPEFTMPAFSWLVLAAVAWIALHLGVSGTALRGRIVARIGDGPFRGLFSLASLLAVAWLAMSYGNAGPVRGLWATPHWLLVACMLMMLPALVLLVGSVSTPNPTLIAGPRARTAGDPARGVLRITRHPMLWSFAIWALVHMVLFGTLGALVFFGAFLVVALAGMPSLDAKFAQRALPDWTRFVEATSIVPFAAILKGRNRLVLSEIGWWRIAIAIVAWFALVALHPLLFDVPAWRLFVGG
jgi:uncharacterized membrane protein